MLTLGSFLSIYLVPSRSVDSRVFPAGVAFGLFDTDPIVRGQANWRLNYDTLDLALKYPFFIGEKVILSPSLSLFAAQTSERYIINNINVALETNHMSHKQRLFGIGPKMGLN